MPKLLLLLPWGSMAWTAGDGQESKRSMPKHVISSYEEQQGGGAQLGMKGFNNNRKGIPRHMMIAYYAVTERGDDRRASM